VIVVLHWVLRVIGWALVLIAIVTKLTNKKLRWRDAAITAIVGLILAAY
jgi:hypothetical protein